MASNEKKIQNYKIIDLIERYNFLIKIIFIRDRMKKYDFSKIVPGHTNGSGEARFFLA
jgi:hypothetical protein